MQSDKYGIEVVTLENGMKIVLKCIKIPMVYTTLTISCGSIYEERHNNGISHFLEHLIGEEGKVRNKNSKLLYKIAKDGGEVTQETDRVYTTFSLGIHYSVWTRNLRYLLNLVAELCFSKDNFLGEQARILRELSENEEFDSITGQCAFKDHPLAYPMDGRKNTVLSLTPQSIYAWHKRFYQPHRMALVVVGDISMRQVISIIKRSKIFLIENRESPALPPRIAIDWDAGCVIEGICKNRMRIIFPAPPAENILDNFLIYIIVGYILDDDSLFSLEYTTNREFGLYDKTYDATLYRNPCCGYLEVDITAPSQKILKKIEKKFFAWLENIDQRGIHRDIFRSILMRRIALIDESSFFGGEWWANMLQMAISEGFLPYLNIYREMEFLNKREMERVFREYLMGKCLIFRSFNQKAKDNDK